MSEIDSLVARIDTLEMRFAYQDQVIEDLNRTITEQWKHIDALTRRSGQSRRAGAGGGRQCGRFSAGAAATALLTAIRAV